MITVVVIELSVRIAATIGGILVHRQGVVMVVQVVLWVRVLVAGGRFLGPATAELNDELIAFGCGVKHRYSAIAIRQLLRRCSCRQNERLVLGPMVVGQ